MRWATAPALVVSVVMAGPVAAQQATPSPPARALGVVLASALNVRTAPALDADVVTTVARADTVCVLSVEGDWAKIRLPTSSSEAPVLEGFASRGFLSEVRVAASTLQRAGCGSPGS